ncbi:AbfB domain-containing protein [Actinomadura adrarensis]|uniref:AbfB domain-containing protein n=1 Tax=Actinomadura adrarensis TaxID=1819600 RepID=A0ABW3CR76_9ACTN
MPARTSRVIIHNKTSYFKMVRTFDHLCGGEWTPGGWRPPNVIEPGRSGGLQSESDGIATGTEGYVKYDVIWGARRQGMVYIYWNNPYLGVTRPRFATHLTDVLPDCDYEAPGDGSTFSVDKNLNFYLAPIAYRHSDGGGDITSPGDLAAAFAAGPLGGVGLLFGLSGIVKDPQWEYELRDGQYGTLSAELAGGFSRFRSYNIPGHYIRHRNFLGEISHDGQPAEDFKFALVNRGPKTVALRSLNFPDRYLRHQHFEMKLHASAGPDDDLWLKDTTFYLDRGLADSNGISFRSVNYPDRYIRHRNFRLYIEPADTSLAKADATFYRI